MEPPRVLVVDDEQLILWSLAECLGDAGFEVRQADCGAGAREQFGDGLSLVFLDLRLPDTDGVSLLREFRAASPNLPVVLMTAHHTPEVVEAAREAGVVQIVDKPFDVTAMVALAQEIVRKDAAARA
ncbi:MAG: response regulator [Myxococcota bacterium]